MKKHNIKPKTPLITDSSQALATTSTISFPQIPHLLLHIDELYFFLLPAAIPVSRQPPPSPSPSSAHRQTDASPRQTNATARNPSTADRRSPLQAAPSSSSSQHPPPTAPASMSQDQSTAHSSAASASTPSGCSSRESVPKSITFGEHDQPIGPDAAQLSSLIGNLVRTYVSPIYEAWTNVPNEIKEQIWLGVISTYNINEIHKIFVMKKANISWKGWKYMLRHQAIDKYLTDVERKSNVPKYVKPEDWVKFVDISSTSAALAAREAGKIARSKLKSPHTTGRKGQARVAAELISYMVVNCGVGESKKSESTINSHRSLLGHS
eukprot:TRINITY_DN17290_c0_g1_i6.p1 TRINITY_DN17290_c0_g1~~TRINITY_DN17290_c0_g1_i6.p1  ORF type:complete len:323 (+),score=40.58 TRINITY_DN17290_c0_g1_i6:508-1476(+)